MSFSGPMIARNMKPCIVIDLDLLIKHAPDPVPLTYISRSIYVEFYLSMHLNNSVLDLNYVFFLFCSLFFFLYVCVCVCGGGGGA